MPNVLRSLYTLLIPLSLFACSYQTELPGSNQSVFNDDTKPNDGTEQSIGDVNSPFSDGLIAPKEPILSVQAAPGALQFIWNDRHNKSVLDITKVSLFEYDNRSNEETIIAADIDTKTTRYRHNISSHTLAWNNTSYRLEICNADNCLSSMRMPVKDLLINALTTIQPEDSDIAHSFGHQIALNAEGNVAVITSPSQACVLVYFNVADKWVQASELSSQNFTEQLGSTMQVAISASGDTILAASIANNVAPVVVVFDRLGENWIETDAVTPSTSMNMNQAWFTDSLLLNISDNGDRFAVVAHSDPSSNNASLNDNNNVLIFERGDVNWAYSTALTIPRLHTRLPSFASNANLDKVYVLSALTENLYLHEFSLTDNTWSNATETFISNIRPSTDNAITSSAGGDEVVIAAWEIESNASRSPVAWRLRKSSNSWVANDSVKLPPINNATATLRLASDATLNSMVVGWQASNDANLAFYSSSESLWQHLFSAPSAFNLNRTLPFAQSIAISADNSTIMVGTSENAQGGLAAVFQ